MPPDETLSAVISATDDVSQTLERVAENFRDIAETASAAGSAARNAAEGFDEAEDEGSALNRALNSISEGGAAASGGMGAASGSAEGLQASFDEAEDEAAELSRSLSNVAPSSASAVGGMGSAASAAAGVERRFDEAEDEVSALNRELQETIASSVAATAGVGGIGSVIDSMQTSFDYEFGLEEEEKAAHRVIDRMEEGADIAEEQSRIGWFSDEDETGMVEAENRVLDRPADQRALDAEHWEEPEAVAHLRSEGFDDIDDSLRRIGQRHRSLPDEYELEGEIDIDDRPLGRVENTLVRVGDRLGVLDRSSYEATFDVDADVDDSPVNRATRSINDVDREIDEVDGQKFEVEGEVDVDDSPVNRATRSISGVGREIDEIDGKGFDVEGEVDVDDRPLGSLENRLVRIGDRMGVLDRSSFEAEGEVDIDDSPINRVIRSIGDAEQRMTGLGGKRFEAEGEVDVDVDDRPLGRLTNTLAQVGDRIGILDQSSFEAEGEVDVDVDDRPLGRLTNTLAQVGDRIGILDQSSFEAEGEVDVDADSSRIERVIRSIGDVERGISEVDGQEFEVEGEVEIDENRFQRLGNRLGMRFGDSFSATAGSATDTALRQVIDTFDADIEHPAETQEHLHGLGRTMQRLPDFEYDFDEDEDLDVFAQQLQTGVRGSQELADVMEDVGDDDIIGEATGLEDLTQRMRDAGYETRNARQAIERMEGSGREFSDQLVADATDIKMYRSQVDELGDEALDTSVRIDKLSGEARELAGSAAMSAASVLGLGEAIEEAGDEAGGAVAKVAAFDAAVQRMGPNLAEVSTTFAGFRTSLKTLAQMAPMMLSLASALGAVATAGASAAGGLGFIMGGGLLAAGQQRGEALAATPGDPEEMEGAMQDAHEASSDLGRSMAGIQDIMEDLKQAAFEAMAPLRTPEFADFSLWVLENAVTLLHEVAQGVAAMADHFMEFARVAAASFWETFPEVVHQMNMIVAEFLTGDLTTAVIESIPGILESFRTEGRELIPMISDLIAEWVQALPSLMRLGTAMLKFLIPALAGLAKGLNLVSPLTEFAAEVLTILADALGPVIEGFFGMMGIIYGAAMTMTTATSAAVALLAIFTGALAIIAGWVLMFTKLAKAGMWLGSVIVKIVTFLTGLTATVVTAVGILVGLVAVIAGLLTYFDLWDDALVGLARTWNWIVDLFNSGAGLVADGIEGMVNTGIRALNKLIDKVDTIPGVDQLEEIELEGDDAFSQHKVSEERARELGEKANLGERAEGGIENPADNLDPTPESASGSGGRGTQGHPNRRGSGQGKPQNTGSHIETMNVFSSPETDDEEIRRAARQAVEEANMRERRTNSSLN